MLNCSKSSCATIHFMGQLFVDQPLISRAFLTKLPMVKYNKSFISMSLTYGSYQHWLFYVQCHALLSNGWCFVVMSHIPRLTIKTPTSTADLASSFPNYLCEVIHYLRKIMTLASRIGHKLTHLSTTSNSTA